MQITGIYIILIPNRIFRQDGFSMGYQDEKSPLARLVVVMVCLSVAGTFVAGLHYYAVDLPQQNAVQVPGNADTDDVKTLCYRAFVDCQANCPYVGSKYECDRYCDCYENACNADNDRIIKGLMHSCVMEGEVRGNYIPPNIPSYV